jgi:hypothetical protein
MLEMEAVKVQKIEQTKVLKDQTNKQDHKRKLLAISFTAKNHQKDKDDDAKCKHIAKQKKFQGGSSQMGLLLGEICKQMEVNGGCVPNPGTTSIPLVSFRLECWFRIKKMH